MYLMPVVARAIEPLQKPGELVLGKELSSRIFDMNSTCSHYYDCGALITFCTIARLFRESILVDEYVIQTSCCCSCWATSHPFSSLSPKKIKEMMVSLRDAAQPAIPSLLTTRK